MSQFAVTYLPLAGLKFVERQLLRKSRSFLSRLLCAEELASADPGRLAHGFHAAPSCWAAFMNQLDVRLAINWPLPITELSTRVEGHPLIETGFKGVSL